jgi:hypothetical protein
MLDPRNGRSSQSSCFITPVLSRTTGYQPTTGHIVLLKALDMPGDRREAAPYEGPGQKYREYRAPYQYGHCRALKSPVAQRSL